jgi:hypothetical protein
MSGKEALKSSQLKNDSFTASHPGELTMITAIVPNTTTVLTAPMARERRF